MCDDVFAHIRLSEKQAVCVNTRKASCLWWSEYTLSVSAHSHLDTSYGDKEERNN